MLNDVDERFKLIQNEFVKNNSSVVLIFCDFIPELF